MTTSITFELAKLLKEKGFEERTKSYTEDGKLVTVSLTIRRFNPEKIYYPSPTITEVVMWLHEKHGIWVVVNPHKGKNNLGEPIMEFDPEVWSFTDECVFHNTGLLYFNSPTEAYLAAIEYTLNNLI